MGPSLSGADRVILLVEDEFLIALDLERMLKAQGFAVRTAHRSAEALAMLAAGLEPVGALVDLNLGRGDDGAVVADELAVRGVPFLFTTGYGQAGVPERHAGRPVLQKPYRESAVRTAVARLFGEPAAVPSE